MCVAMCTKHTNGSLLHVSSFSLRFKSRDSIVSIMTSLWAGWSGVRFLAGGLDAEDFSPGLRRPGRGVDFSYLCPFRLVECRCTSSPPVYLYGAHRGDFATALCPLGVSCPFALIFCTSYLPLGVSDCHAC